MTIFVFGSNLAGRHGRGAAWTAHVNHGAAYGCGVGRTGSAYAIPTKDIHLQPLTLTDIAIGVTNFKRYARLHPELEFKVTRIGCGLAGYTDQEIAPMFMDAPSNCQFDTAWSPYLEFFGFWGTR